jgi:hypothetical protein
MADDLGGELTANWNVRFDMSALIRLGIWGACAVAALACAVFAARFELPARPTGETQAAAVAPTDVTRLINTAQLTARVNEVDAENRRLAESVRMLGVDQDRLTARVSVIERNLDGMTGSITRSDNQSTPVRTITAESAPISTTSNALPTSAASAPMPIAPPLRSPITLTSAPQPPPAIQPASATTEAPTSRSGRLAMIESYARAKSESVPGVRAATNGDSPADSVVTTTDFGVDLGGAASVNGLRTLWISLKTKHAQLLNGLWPIISVHDRAKPGAVELRLVAGPLSNAGLAARLCTSFAGLGVPCQPAVFDGQRLALR